MDLKIKNASALYLEGIRAGDIEAVHRYTGAYYKQHSTGVKDGKEGFIEFFKDFIQRCPVRDIEIIRAWSDGEYAFLMAFQDINNGEAQWVTTDFFRYDEDDKILEHWDVISAFAGPNPSGHTQIDGPTEITDLDKTESNRRLVLDLINDALMPGGDPNQLDRYISSETYIQHNKEVGDGLAHFQKLASMSNRPLNYKKVHLCVAQGNFVATLSEANWNDGQIHQDYAQVDIFRIENGKIVEHWDNVEPVPEVSVNSGKF